MDTIKSLGGQTFTNLTEMMQYVRNSNNTSPSIFFMCVSNPEAVDAVMNEHGLLENIKPTDHLVDMSTVDVDCVKRSAAKIENFLEAPVSGSKPQANSGTLVILAAGKKNTYDLASPFLEKMGKRTFYFGETVGAGAKMKLCVNMFMGSVMCSLSESLKL